MCAWDASVGVHPDEAAGADHRAPTDADAGKSAARGRDVRERAAEWCWLRAVPAQSTPDAVRSAARSCGASAAAARPGFPAELRQREALEATQASEAQAPAREALRLPEQEAQQPLQALPLLCQAWVPAQAAAEPCTSGAARAAAEQPAAEEAALRERKARSQAAHWRQL